MKKILFLILCLILVVFYFQDEKVTDNNPLDSELVVKEISHDKLPLQKTVKHIETPNTLESVPRVIREKKEIMPFVEQKTVEPSDFNLENSFETTDYYDAFLNAYNKEKYEEVVLYAENLLKIPDKYSSNFWYGNLCHATYIILGKTYLFLKNIEKAEFYLIKSVNNKCIEKSIDGKYSPQLMSFGPDRSLAHSLYLKGRRKSILHFFELTKKFWESGVQDGIIENAISNIKTTDLSYEQEDDSNFPFEPTSYTVDYSNAPMSSPGNL